MNNLESPVRQKWREIVRRQNVSGMSASAFCRENGIAPGSFFAWRRKLAEPAPAVAPGFVEAKIVESRARHDKIQVRLRGGRSLIVRPGFDRELLAEVVAAVEGLP